jgi:hypothetical protein
MKTKPYCVIYWCYSVQSDSYLKIIVVNKINFGHCCISCGWMGVTTPAHRCRLSIEGCGVYVSIRD